MNIIGENCHYRPAFSRIEKISKVVGIKQMINGDNKKSTMFVLDDGSELESSDCYFSLSEMDSDNERIASATSLMELATS